MVGENCCYALSKEENQANTLLLLTYVRVHRFLTDARAVRQFESLDCTNTNSDSISIAALLFSFM